MNWREQFKRAAIIPCSKMEGRAVAYEPLLTLIGLRRLATYISLWLDEEDWRRSNKARCEHELWCGVLGRKPEFHPRNDLRKSDCCCGTFIVRTGDINWLSENTSNLDQTLCLACTPCRCNIAVDSEMRMNTYNKWSITYVSSLLVLCTQHIPILTQTATKCIRKWWETNWRIVMQEVCHIVLLDAKQLRQLAVQNHLLVKA